MFLIQWKVPLSIKCLVASNNASREQYIGKGEVSPDQREVQGGHQIGHSSSGAIHSGLLNIERIGDRYTQ